MLVLVDSWRKGAWLAVAVPVLVFIRCIGDYNPFSDPLNASAVIRYQTIQTGDTVTIFSTETLTTVVKVKELVDSFSLSIPGNRLWTNPDTMLDRSAFEGEPLNFLYSFHDTGWQTVILASWRNNGSMHTDTMRIYARSPLSQDSVQGAYGDSIRLRTPAVRDKDVVYQWYFGNGTTIVSLVCSTTTTIATASLTDTAYLRVSDQRFSSPRVPFIFSLRDTVGPRIDCANDGFSGKDTIYTGDTIFNLKVKISDASSARIDSASIDGKPFDYSYGAIYYRFIKEMYRYRRGNPLVVEVYALDAYRLGNATRKQLVLIYSDSLAQTSPVRVSISQPLGNSAQTSNAFYLSQGLLEAHMVEPVSIALHFKLNDNTETELLVVKDTLISWERQLPLQLGVNHFWVRASNATSGILLGADSAVVVFTPDIADTTGPRILEVRCDTALADGYLSPRARVQVRMRVVDDGVGIQSVSIDSSAATVVGTSSWYADSITLAHGTVGNEIVVKAEDKKGNRSERTVRLFFNRQPVLTRKPTSKLWYTDTLYRDSVAVVDPDGDRISITKIAGPSDLFVDQDGSIRWKPDLGDTGTALIRIGVDDGYQPVLLTYSLFVYPVSVLLKPLQFQTQVEDFPAFLEAGKDTLRVGLQVKDGSGFGSVRYSARLIKNNKVLLRDTLSSLLLWVPLISDTGFQQLIVSVRDDIRVSDTLYPGIRVVVINRPCSLSVAYRSTTRIDGVIDLNKFALTDTFTYRIHDPDGPQTERFRVSTYQASSRTTTVVDSALTDTFKLVFDPTAANGYDTITVAIRDRAGHTDSMRSVLYYGSAPIVPHTPLPATAQTAVAVSGLLRWLGGDTDGDSLLYDVYWGLQSTSLTYQKTVSVPQCTYTALSGSTLYYWKVVSADWKSRSEGAVWRFTTQ